jgi:hypothetical protein
VSSNPTNVEVCSIQLYVIKFVNDLRPVSDFHRVLRLYPPISGVKHHNSHTHNTYNNLIQYKTIRWIQRIWTNHWTIVISIFLLYAHKTGQLRIWTRWTFKSLISQISLLLSLSNWILLEYDHTVWMTAIYWLKIRKNCVRTFNGRRHGLLNFTEHLCQ